MRVSGPGNARPVEYAACLACGTCLAVAAPGALKWRYPRGGFSVQFREGWRPVPGCIIYR